MKAQGNILSRADLEELERLVDALDRSLPTASGERSVVIRESALTVLRRGVALLREAERPALSEPPGVVGISEAADILNVPETHVEQLLDSGELPSSGTVGERCIPRADLLSYKERWDADRLHCLNEMVRADQEDGLYEREWKGEW